MDLLLVVLGVVSCVLYVLVRSSRRKMPYPPGPKPDPIIGNFRHMGKYAPWFYYTELKKQYGELGHHAHSFKSLPSAGDVVHLKTFGQSVIILNSYEAIQELLVRQATTFLERPRLVMCGEL